MGTKSPSAENEGLAPRLYVQYSDKTYLRLAAVSWFHRLQDKRTLCASAVAATSGTAASCRPIICLAPFLAPTLSLSLSRSLHGWAAGCRCSSGSWWDTSESSSCQSARGLEDRASLDTRVSRITLDHTMNERPWP